MIRDVSETIYDFKSLIDDLNNSKSLLTMLRSDRHALTEINIALQRYLGPTNSIHVLSDFLDNFDSKSKLAKKLKSEDLSELMSLGNKLIELDFIPPEKLVRKN